MLTKSPIVAVVAAVQLRFSRVAYCPDRKQSSTEAIGLLRSFEPIENRKPDGMSSSFWLDIVV